MPDNLNPQDLEDWDDIEPVVGLDGGFVMGVRSCGLSAEDEAEVEAYLARHEAEQYRDADRDRDLTHQPAGLGSLPTGQRSVFLSQDASGPTRQ